MPGLLEDDFERDLDDDLDPDFEAGFFGTLTPSFLVSDNPIAIACLREVTFLPEPVFNFPSFFRAILLLLYHLHVLNTWLCSIIISSYLV